MTESFATTAGCWWRFDHYELLDGWIRPTKGAKLERYDPWEIYRQSEAAGDLQPPYNKLLDLVQGLTFQPRAGPGKFLELDSDSAERLVTWCQANGLLGILSHQVLMATLAVRWEPLEENEIILVPTQVQYGRTAEGWTTFCRWKSGAPLGHLRDQAERRGELIPAESTPGDWPEPGVIIQPLDNSGYQAEPFSQTWAQFFPDLPDGSVETHPYPAPLSEAFWRCYGEPVNDFVKAAKLLLNALNGLRSKKPLSKASDMELQQIRSGKNQLHALVRVVSPSILPLDDGSIRQEWVSTSLLGSFAMMALLDLTESRRVLTCQKCDRLFVTKAYQALYCSKKCRQTVQKRRQRDNQKQKQA